MLTLSDLAVTSDELGPEQPLLQDINLSLGPGQTLAIVGESGCGKTLTASALVGLLPSGLHADFSACRFEDPRSKAVLTDPRNLRGRAIACVFQQPNTALNPTMRIGRQIAEAVQLHQNCSRRQARTLAVDLLRDVGLQSPSERIHAFPHELSGGMQQRVVLAIALACQPCILLADEPTTALDVTTQAAILTLIKRLQSSRRMAIILITHDWRLLPGLADDVAVMYAGTIVEKNALANLFSHPRHPYSRALMRLADATRPSPPIPGNAPRPGAYPTGCSFHPRCERAETRCKEMRPPLLGGVACHRPY